MDFFSPWTTLAGRPKEPLDCLNQQFGFLGCGLSHPLPPSWLLTGDAVDRNWDFRRRCCAHSATSVSTIKNIGTFLLARTSLWTFPKATSKVAPDLWRETICKAPSDLCNGLLQSYHNKSEVMNCKHRCRERQSTWTRPPALLTPRNDSYSMSIVQTV